MTAQGQRQFGFMVVVVTVALMARVVWVVDWSVGVLFLLGYCQLWAIMRAIVVSREADATPRRPTVYPASTTAPRDPHEKVH